VVRERTVLLFLCRPKHQITKAKRENDKIIFSKSFALLKTSFSLETLGEIALIFLLHLTKGEFDGAF